MSPSVGARRPLRKALRPRVVSGTALPSMRASGIDCIVGLVTYGPEIRVVRERADIDVRQDAGSMVDKCGHRMSMAA